ncbi:hypothetical protein [Macrococcus equipercicus]|uniref:Uncharacterized protein n=1 Tax=Macrococcus equipercicus TaxID=69967 RepID=A0A9Q9BVT2_9STAP|nr:hypothetical protein [Macrococcus equipercicus]UTH14132.1 hypothetical protein KFV11_01800 [Macrococcus equipercicus]
MLKKQFIMSGILLITFLLLSNGKDVKDNPWLLLVYIILIFFYAFIRWLWESEPYQWRKKDKK